MSIDLFAPIIPGVGAASIRLGEKMEAVLHRTGPIFTAEVDQSMKHLGIILYRSSDVDVFAQEDTIYQIMVHGGYGGKFQAMIGIGSSLADIEKFIGPVEAILDNLVVRGIPGISFEPTVDKSDAPIVEIFVWEPDWVELGHHKMSQLYDITRTISPSIAVWPGDSPFQMDVIAAIAEGSSVNLTTIHLSSHTGTHADAWWHYSDDGARIGAMPLDRYLGLVQVIRVARTAGGITVSDLGNVNITGAQRILLHTVISDLPDNQWPEPFPYLTVELVDYLADHGICLIGIDSPSVDAVDSKLLPCHHQIRARGMANLENLQLRGVPDGCYELIALPLRLEAACGSPVRAVLRSLA